MGNRKSGVDIKGIITASNELPPKQESFQPLWDRFLIRYQMRGIREQQKFLAMITDTKDVYQDHIPASVKITEEEWQKWDNAIQQIEIPPEVLNSIQVIRIKLGEYNQCPNRDTEPIRGFRSSMEKNHSTPPDLGISQWQKGRYFSWIVF